MLGYEIYHFIPFARLIAYSLGLTMEMGRKTTEMMITMTVDQIWSMFQTYQISLSQKVQHWSLKREKLQ